MSELRDCVNREVGLGSHSLSHSSPDPNVSVSEPRSCVNKEVDLGSYSLSLSSTVPNKPYGFCGRVVSVSEPRSCVNKEVDLGSFSLSLSSTVPNKPYGFCGRVVSVSDSRSCVNVEVGWARALIPHPILPPFLISHTVNVNVKHHERKKDTRASEVRSCVNWEKGLDSHSLSYSSPDPNI